MSLQQEIPGLQEMAMVLFFLTLGAIRMRSYLRQPFSIQQRFHAPLVAGEISDDEQIGLDLERQVFTLGNSAINEEKSGAFTPS